MKIEIFEISSKNDKIYLELLEQYKNNPEVKMLLDDYIIDSVMILAGDFRLITMVNLAIEMDDVEVYLVKNVENNSFVWVIGKFISNGKISMYPLLKEQSKSLQLEIRKALIEKNLINDSIVR